MIAIAIDGPSGAGKSTLARELARSRGFVYIDTGALYRAVGLFATRAGADTGSAEQVAPLLRDIKLELCYERDGQHVIMNGEDVSSSIRSPEMSMAASAVSALPEVRAFLLGLQRDIAEKNNVVMDGRDIGTIVLPNAGIKIFLTASPEERAHRRCNELLMRGEQCPYEQVLSDIIQRDNNDTTRAIAPLIKAPDATLLDTTGNDFNQSLTQLMRIVEDNL